MRKMLNVLQMSVKDGIIELDEFNVSIIVYNINPHPEVEDMTVRSTKETNIILIARLKGWICCGCWVAVDSFFLEGDPNSSLSMLLESFYSVTLFLIHLITLSFVYSAHEVNVLRSKRLCRLWHHTPGLVAAKSRSSSLIVAL